MPSALITVAFPVQPTRALALLVHGSQVHSAAAWASDSHLSPTLWGLVSLRTRPDHSLSV